MLLRHPYIHKKTILIKYIVYFSCLFESVYFIALVKNVCNVKKIIFRNLICPLIINCSLINNKM